MIPRKSFCFSFTKEIYHADDLLIGIHTYATFLFGNIIQLKRKHEMDHTDPSLLKENLFSYVAVFAVLGIAGLVCITAGVLARDKWVIIGGVLVFVFALYRLLPS